MKKLILTSVFAVLTASMTIVMAQNQPKEYLGLPGDNLNLYAVMNLFQESETLEGFERSLNDGNTMINNLDLNGDNIVDYITVSDYVDGEVHTIVLRAALERNEYQDVAVFTVQKFSNGAVQIQLIGDEALYGRNYIIEPVYAETPNPGYIGTKTRKVKTTVVTTTYYEVAAWPLIRYIYLPTYVVWRSSWYWGYYPAYWQPWSPFYWHYYYGYHYNWHTHYYRYYRPWTYYRYPGYTAHYYTSIRKSSPTVIVNIQNNHYKTTYSRPELKSEGEAHYSRVQANRGTSNRHRETVNSQSRGNSAVHSGRTNTREGNVPGTGNRTSAAVRTRTENTQSPANNSGAVRKASTANERTVSGNTSGRKNEAARVSGSTGTKRTTSNPAAVRNTTTTRSTTPAPAERKAAVTSPQNRTSVNSSERKAATAPAVRNTPATNKPAATVTRPATRTTNVQKAATSRSSSVRQAPASGSKAPAQVRSSSSKSSSSDKKSSSQSENRSRPARSR